MNTGIILAISMAAALGATVVKKMYTERDERLSGSFLYTAVGSLVAAVVLFLWGGMGSASTFTVLLGIVFGSVTALQSVTNMLALQTGPLSYTSVIISFSTLLSAFSGVLFFDETIGAFQIVGILLMLVSFVLANGKDASGKHANVKWLLLCIVAFFATGVIGILQKVHQGSEFRGELNAFLIIAFAVSALFSAVAFGILRCRDHKRKVEAPHMAVYLFASLMILNGAFVAVNNKLNLYLSGVMDSAVFFPLVNGGGLVLTTLTALLIFRERLTGKQWVGVGFGIASVIFLCLG